MQPLIATHSLGWQSISEGVNIIKSVRDDQGNIQKQDIADTEGS